MKVNKIVKINAFEQIKAFYGWVFNNPDKVRPQHISLYLFLWNQANRAHWVKWFKCPFDLAMQGACIGNKKTYYTALAQLEEFSLIMWRRGVNENKAPLIHMIKLDMQDEDVTVPLSEFSIMTKTDSLSELLNKNTYSLAQKNYKLVNANLESWILESKVEKVEIKKVEVEKVEVEKVEIKKVNTVLERKEKFIESLQNYIATYGQEIITEFGDYWCELTKNGFQMRWEKEVTWELNLRLQRWVRNSKKTLEIKPQNTVVDEIYKLRQKNDKKI